MTRAVRGRYGDFDAQKMEYVRSIMSLKVTDSMIYSDLIDGLAELGLIYPSAIADVIRYNVSSSIRVGTYRALLDRGLNLSS